MGSTMFASPHRTHFFTPLSQASPPSSTYRPAVILPGLGNNSGDYQKLIQTLNDKYGVPTVVAKVSRIDWLRNAAGLVDPNYWRGTLRPRPVLDWYLKRVHDAVQEAKELTEGETLSLIGHSAGGWLARVYMEEFGTSHISLLLTLGTPHLPPPKGSPGVIDQTRGLLNYVENNCSKAVYTPQLKYVCVAGRSTTTCRYIEGARFFGQSNPEIESAVPINGSQPFPEAAIMNASSTSAPVTATFRTRFVGQGYKQVCGQADVWGDGVVPEVSAHLEGALNISLDGVYHSPVGSDDELRPWYGSPSVLEKWVEHLLN
ncbi:GPI inositol-deacylase PGAP1-like protein [Senna tora]|uniref:GPI inositol-deacylase n=1 Tax=Senna tora TaxID=362788 RepID=A0A834XIH3_9FABA|nr:GPI inositol-deacylase PGAP1-like protein [Senna tora]